MNKNTIIFWLVFITIMALAKYMEKEQEMRAKKVDYFINHSEIPDNGR